MGIGITSNAVGRTPKEKAERVSIPNGDRHYLEPANAETAWVHTEFQSPMGIGITSNWGGEGAAKKGA